MINISFDQHILSKQKHLDEQLEQHVKNGNALGVMDLLIQGANPEGVGQDGELLFVKAIEQDNHMELALPFLGMGGHFLLKSMPYDRNTGSNGFWVMAGSATDAKSLGGYYSNEEHATIAERIRHYNLSFNVVLTQQKQADQACERLGEQRPNWNMVTQTDEVRLQKLAALQLFVQVMRNHLEAPPPQPKLAPRMGM